MHYAPRSRAVAAEFNRVAIPVDSSGQKGGPSVLLAAGAHYAWTTCRSLLCVRLGTIWIVIARLI